MEEDSELLDWGNEDDESQAQASYPSHYSQRNSVPHDAEDAVSLGGDDDDLHEFSAYQSRPVHDAEQFSHSRSSRPPSTPQRQQTPPPKHRERSGSPHKSSRRNDSPSLIRSQPLSMAKLTHALPPKPVLATASIARSPPLASTLASSMIQRERRLNGQSRGKSVSVEASDGLPPDWEIRYPRNGGREAYYYNVRTHESTWTRPQDVVHVASPAKDSRDSRARSLSRSVDDGAHSQGLPRTALHKDSKRRTSPAPVITTELTYEDRHYRPGDSTVNAQTDRVPRAQARPLSPARSVTPPPRREALARRDLSRSLSPVNDSWRPNARDEDRSWGRHRNEDTRSLSPETRPRGRRQRADIEMPPLEDESIRRDHSREWPAHRHRSPLREASPPVSNSRRGMDSWKPSSPTIPSTSKRKHKTDRVLSPDPKLRKDLGVYIDRDDEVYIPREDVGLLEARKRDSHIPADSVPQRRGRDYLDLTNVEVKRRRMDYDISPPIRRSALPEPEVLPASNSLPQHPATMQEAEVPRRKRQPLPPQSTRFKEASKFPSSPVAPAPNAPPSRPAVQDGRIPNGPSSMYADVPSGPRNQNKGLQGDAASRTSSKTFSRFDNTAIPSRADASAMDVDYPLPSKPQAQRRNDEGIPRSVSATHLNDMQLESIPKGPRAMAGKMAAPPASYPSQANKQDMTRSPANMRGGKLPRQPPPHMAQVREPVSRRESAVGAPALAPQRFEDSLPTGPAKRGPNDTRDMIPPPPANAREPRRNAGPPTAPSMKLSGTNNIPIGTRRATPGTPVSELPGTSADRFRSAPIGQSQRLEPNSRYSDNYNSLAQDIESDDRHYRPLLDRRQQSDFEREASNNFSRLPPPESQETLPSSRRQRRDSLVGQDDRANRATRFGPEPMKVSPVDPSSAESRTWLTRDESQEMVNRMGRPTSGALSQPSTRGPSSSSSWNAPRDDDDFQRNEGQGRARSSEAAEYYQRSRREPSPKYDYPPSEQHRYAGHQSLELRLSSATREFPDQDEYRVSDGKDFDYNYMGPGKHSQSPRLPPHNIPGHGRHWDGYQESSANVRANSHPERVAILESQHPLPPRPDTSKRSVRIKRPQRSPRPAGEFDDGYLNASPNVDASPQRPAARRGASLLDRLQLDNASGPSSASSNSLRDRVEVSMKEPESPISGSQRPLSIAMNDGEGLDGGEMDTRPKGGRGKKRSGKPRRGRRGGPA